MENARELTAVCGLDCFNCPLFETMITEETRQHFAKLLNRTPEETSCKGCRAQKGCLLHMNDCATYHCATAKGVDFCFECADFPCQYLQPAKEGADRFPHNYKLYNLCRIQKVGVERWADEEATNIRNAYYNGKFVPGSGPVL